MTPADAGAMGAALGLANAAHCAGMCGAFAWRAAHGGGAVQLGLYLTGKAFTYVFLGTLAGALGGDLLTRAPWAASAIGIVLACAMMATGVRMLWPVTTMRPVAISAVVTRALGGVRTGAIPGGAFALGAVTAAIPCGAVYLATLAALRTGSPGMAAVFMLGFAAGTAPALVMSTLAGRALLRNVGGLRLRRLGGGLLVLVAAVTAWRALAPLLQEHGSCCG